jgi:flagellar biosynthetic protein FliO
MRKGLMIVVALCGLCLMRMAIANEAPAAEAVQEQEFNYKREFFNMLFTLAFVVALILASAAMLKRFAKSRMHHANTANLIKILERRPLSAKTMLYLVEVGEKNILIADAPSGVTTLTELPKEAGGVEEVVSPSKPSFLEIIQSKLRQAGAGLLKKN